MRYNYKKARNKYVWIRREQEKNSEKNMDKCKKEPKLNYKFINSKIEVRDSIQILKVDGKIYEGAKDMSDITDTKFSVSIYRRAYFWRTGMWNGTGTAGR